MMPKFYRLFFQLTGDDRLAFESLTSNAEAVEAAVAACAAVWRDKMRATFDGPLTCRQFFALRARLAAASLGVRGLCAPNVSAAFALFLADLVEQRVRALDLEENRDGADVPDTLAAGTLVKVQKVSSSATPMVEPGEWDAWVMGSPDNAGSLPVGYSLHGVLLKPLRVGAPIHVLRVKRNGVTAVGEFTSTTVAALHLGHLAETVNSFYIVRPTDIASVQDEEQA
jgi:hypothetical protein